MLIAMPVPSTVPTVPFYSQFRDIAYAPWQKVGCGVASLAMVIDYYTTSPVSVDTVLGQATSSGAYNPAAGWTYKGLIAVSQKYGLDGKSYDLSAISAKAALAEFTNYVQGGPVIASVHYKFDPTSTIPHLVVIDGIAGGQVYYNDPAAKTGEKTISIADFDKGWKKRFIVVRPAKETASLALAK